MDFGLVGDKLRRLRSQFDLTIADVAVAVGMDPRDLAAIEAGQKRPTGDQILVLADFYKCSDYKTLISSEALATIDQTEKLFRKHKDSLSRDDRWAIQEFLYLCECESFLEEQLHRPTPPRFKPHKRGHFYKQQGAEAASALRQHFGYASNLIHLDVFHDFRSQGIHVFRRRLGNSAISGLYLRHPVIGKCILVNYDEDIYRQRFTVAHEAGHAFLDDSDVVLTFHSHWSSKELSEIRANHFASNYLMPPDFLKSIPEPHIWTEAKILQWSDQLRVNPRALVYALKSSELIDSSVARTFEKITLRTTKRDSEIHSSLTASARKRRTELLQRGLSNDYFALCFDAYAQGIISGGRLAEMLLVSYAELEEVAGVFGRSLGQS